MTGRTRSGPEADNSGDGVSELGDPDILAGTDIDRLFRRPVTQQKDGGVGRIVDMHKLAPRFASAPNRDGLAAFLHCVVQLADQGRNDVTLQRVEIVAGPIQVRRYDGDEIAAVLPPIGLAQFDSGDFGHAVPFIGRLEWAFEQRILDNRLRPHLWVHAGRPKKHELPDFGSARCLDHIRRDCQVVVEEIGGLPVICIDPADRRGRKENDIGAIFIEPGEDCGLIAQIEDFSTQRQKPAILVCQSPHQGGAQHPAMPGDAYPPAPEIERRITHYLDPHAVFWTRRILSAAPHQDISGSSARREPSVLGWEDQSWSARSSCCLFIFERPGMSRRRASR